MAVNWLRAHPRRIAKAVGSCGFLHAGHVLNGTESSLAGSQYIVGISDSNLRDETFQSGRRIDHQDFGTFSAYRIKAIGKPRLDMQKIAAAQLFLLSRYRELQLATEDIEGLRLSAMNMLGGTRSLFNEGMRQCVAAVGFGLTRDY
ncbi:hypothetical protein XI05_09970 [Bradyrhizobium sp. CCBAU 11357]|nr:hypothetical protein [Bradyrhizobium sp. CCBAU 11357]